MKKTYVLSDEDLSSAVAHWLNVTQSAGFKDGDVIHLMQIRRVGWFGRQQVEVIVTTNNP